MGVSLAWMSVLQIHTHLIPEEVRRKFQLKELELWLGVSHHWVEKQTKDLWESSQCSQLLSHLSSPNRKGLLMWIFPAFWGAIRMLHALPHSRVHCLSYQRRKPHPLYVEGNMRVYYHPEYQGCLHRDLMVCLLVVLSLEVALGERYIYGC